MPLAGSVIWFLICFLLLIQFVLALDKNNDDEKHGMGDDFFNNLASDLKEYLAVFADRFTMQFLSQSLTTSDYILASIKSPGVMTTLVSAIRAGGPQRLRDMFGKAAENTAAAELEVMSSTSREVGELYNGREVVRCLGQAPIWEFIYLIPDKLLPETTKTKEMSMKEAVDQGYMRMVSYARKKTFWQKVRDLLSFQSVDDHDETPENGSKSSIHTHHTEAVIVRIVRPEAPNISLNRSKNTGRGELRFAAGVAIFLFLLFSLCSYLITCHPEILPTFLKDGSPVPSYAFACTFFGSLFSDFGSYISAYVIGSSTKEEIFQPAKNWRARMVWVQGEKIVGDQEFKPFAIFSGEDQPNIITSSRVDDNQGPGYIRRHLENLTYRGAVLNMIGSVLQAVGFRASHCSVSILYLIVVLIMLIVKMVVRRGRSRPIFSRAIIPGFQFAWLADSLRDPSSAPWLKDRNELSKESLDKSSSRVSNELTGGRTGGPDPDEAQESTRRLQSLVRLASSPSPPCQEATQLVEAMEEVMGILHKNSSRVAFTWTDRVQAGEANVESLKHKITKQPDGKWKADVGRIAASLSLKEFYARIKAEPQSPSGSFENDAERLYECCDMPGKKIRILGAHKGSLVKQLKWWTPVDGPQILVGQAQYIAAEESHTTDDGSQQNHVARSNKKFEIGESFVTGLDPRLGDVCIETANAVSLLSQGESTSRSETFNHGHAVTDPEPAFGCSLQLPSPYSRNSGRGKWEFKVSERDTSEPPSEGSSLVLFVESCDSLPVFFAKDMFATFMWAALEAIEAPIEGETVISQEEVKTDEIQGLGKHCNLENSVIHKLVRRVQSTGLFSKSDAYHSIILPLSMQKKLPDASIVVEKVRDSAKQPEACRHWDAAVADYLWLSNNMDAFPARSHAFMRAAAVLVAFETALQSTVDPMTATDVGTASKTADRLRESMEGIDPKLMEQLRSFCKLNDADEWRQSFWSHYKGLLLSSYEVYGEDGTDSEWSAQTSAREQDMFDRTPLHYMAALVRDADVTPEKASATRFVEDEAKSVKFRQRVGALINYGNAIDACDLRGWTPLHYASRAGNIFMTRLLLEKGASVDAQSRDGTAAIHCAADGGHWQVVQLLIEFGANVDVVDGAENTALHVAALRGSVKVVNTLRQGGCRSLRNKLGQRAIHLAAMQGQAAVIEHLQDDVGFKDFAGKTSLRTATELGHTPFVKQLLELSKAQVELLLSAKLTQDELRLTPLYLACEGGHDDVVEALLDNGAPIDGLGKPFETPLFFALQEHKESIVRLLVKKGANLELREERGRTLLHWAMEERNTAIAKLLLRLGADVQAVNNARETPQMIAERVGLSQWWRDNMAEFA